MAKRHFREVRTGKRADLSAVKTGAVGAPLRLEAIVCRFAGTCRACGELIAAGSPALWLGAGLIWHRACAASRIASGWNATITG